MAEAQTLDQQLEYARELRNQQRADTQKNRDERNIGKTAAHIARHPIKSVKEAGEMALQFGSARLLQQAWFWLIWSFGLTLIYIDIHALGRIFFPNVFCRLGDEWLPVKTKTARAAATPIMWFETAAVIGLNMLAFLIIVIIIAIIGTIAGVADKWYVETAFTVVDTAIKVKNSISN